MEQIRHFKVSQSDSHGFVTTSRVKNEWTQPGSLYGEPNIL